MSTISRFLTVAKFDCSLHTTISEKLKLPLIYDDKIFKGTINKRKII